MAALREKLAPGIQFAKLDARERRLVKALSTEVKFTRPTYGFKIQWANGDHESGVDGAAYQFFMKEGGLELIKSFPEKPLFYSGLDMLIHSRFDYG